MAKGMCVWSLKFRGRQLLPSPHLDVGCPSTFSFARNESVVKPASQSTRGCGELRAQPATAESV